MEANKLVKTEAVKVIYIPVGLHASTVHSPSKLARPTIGLKKTLINIQSPASGDINHTKNETRVSKEFMSVKVTAPLTDMTQILTH